MFSIAAINDTEVGGQWEPLAPTKEALEFHLSQTYHEGLLKLQSKDYEKARELLETVLKDPLVSSARVDAHASDGHLIQLRFLALKNLATVFVQQDPVRYENALSCYLQAVEIDASDSVVWNQLGTLSCSMGLLSTSRWAFEQGLVCSPNNWNCMEKLLEVLIAIGDEVACLSIANLILRHWPSHSRALHIKRTIEDEEPSLFSPRGIDKLEPKHIRLDFSNKRKATQDRMENGTSSKRVNQTLEICLPVPTWEALADGLLGILLSAHEDFTQPRTEKNNDNLTGNVSKVQPDNLSRSEENDASATHTIGKYKDTSMLMNIKTVINLSLSFEHCKDLRGSCDARLGDNVCAKSTMLKERDGCIDEEHPQERRSTRLERLRSRKPGKDDLDSSSSKDLAKVIFQFLEPFIVSRPTCKDIELDGDSKRPSSEVLIYSASHEYNLVKKFISTASNIWGAYHLGHLLLEEIAHNGIIHQNSIIKFLDLEKFTQKWPQNRTPICSLFLAELYYDIGVCAPSDLRRSEFLSDASYHLCKVVEQVSLDIDSDFSCRMNHDNVSQSSKELYDLDRDITLSEIKSANTFSMLENKTPVEEGSKCEESLVRNSLVGRNFAFWARFFWVGGCLSLSSGSTAKSLKEFGMCLSLLRNQNKLDGTCCIPLPHCRIVKWLNIDRVLHLINLVGIGEALKETTKMMEKGMHKECIKLLDPTLLSTEDVYPDLVLGVFDEKGTTDIELSALDVLLSACEKAEPLEICTYLNAHKRKLRVLAYAAGMNMIDSTTTDKFSNNNLMLRGDDSGEVTAEMLRRQWYYRIAQEIKEISRCTTLVKNAIDQTGTNVSSKVVRSVSDLQTLLLTVMCNVARIVLGQKFSTGSSMQTDQIEIQCLIDVLIAFCKLQHIDPTVSIKCQVDLIAAVHDLLAEYGLCCAGKDSEGKEGTFLKLAIKHLFSLDVKLKSSIQLGNVKLEMKKNDCMVSVNERDKVVDGQLKSCLIDDLLTDKNKIGESMNENDLEETTKRSCSVHDATNKEEALECEKGIAEPLSIVGDTSTIHISDIDVNTLEIEREKVELGIDNALDQSFFCLYGLNLKSGQDQSSEDDLAIHKNTNRGDYQTKEQCADVFQYILPYAKASSRAGIVKLRRVLRAIRKHFPQPSDDVLVDNIIDKFLDSPDLCDDNLYKLAEITEIDQSQAAAMNVLCTNGRGNIPKASSFMRSGPYLEVYSNLYYLIAQAEETSATDKFAGFILNKEGAEFVEQNANLFKYDLLYNPLHFKSWQKLANIYDEEVDLLLNDGSKHINNLDWGKNTSLLQRVEKGRRRSRRCLLMSLALARTPLQQSQIHELLGLVYYDSVQNVVPLYDQRAVAPTKDEAWLKFCQNSLKHFEKAFTLGPDWIHAFYLGKLCEKMGYSSAKAFSYYNKAILLNPSAVDPFYRIHASRLKFLYSGKWDADSLKICALYCFSASKKQSVCDILGWTDNDLQQSPVGLKDAANDSFERNTPPKSHKLDEVWHLLYDDCLSALAICTEGELKHYHKARYMLALGYYRRNEKGDLELAKDELSFCFRSTRSPFTINMWEIDGMVKKGKRKTQSLSGNRRVLEVSLPESSRKFITCIRKYILLYLDLLEKSKDLCTLERAYVYLRTDRRFSVCLGDIVPVALGKYIKALTLSISCIETISSPDASSIENLLEKMFHVLMDHLNLWTDISNLPEVKCSELSETRLYEIVHQYIYLVESFTKLDALEAINEKLRKRFKSPKLASINSAKMCKHASLAWCRSILVNLANITPAVHTRNENPSTSADDGSENGLLLFVDVQPNELCNLPLESVYHPKDLETKWCQPLLNLRKVCIQKASEQSSEMAHMLLRSAYNFYKESSCGTFPSGINLYTMLLSPHFVVEDPLQLSKNGIENLDLSIPRKLLLWAYTLVHGQYSNILVVVKHCEENVKSKLKRGTASTTSPQSAASPLAHMGCGKDRNTPEDRGIKENSTDLHSLTNETPKLAVAASELQSCGPELEITRSGHNTTTDTSEL